MEAPDLVPIEDAVPCGSRSVVQEKVDRRKVSAGAIACCMTEGLSIPSTLGMRLKAEGLRDFAGRYAQDNLSSTQLRAASIGTFRSSSNQIS